MQPTTDQDTHKTTTINLRVQIAARDLIDRAAQAAGKNRTEFMLEAARKHAEEILLDQRLFLLDDEAFSAFSQALDETSSENHALKKLLSEQSPWQP